MGAAVGNGLIDSRSVRDMTSLWQKTATVRYTNALHSKKPYVELPAPTNPSPGT